MTDTDAKGEASPAFLEVAEEQRLLELLDYLEEKIPVHYRAELLSYLLPRAIGHASESSGGPPRTERADDAVESESLASVGRPPDEDAGRSFGTESYQALFSRRGETLLKALAAIRFAESRLGVRWMTPGEIVRLLSEIDDSHKLYRSNVSNALRKEPVLVSRRGRGRGFEYGLTRPGRARVDRELALLGIDH